MLQKTLVPGAVAITGALLARRRFRQWGSTPSEMAATLPGDELISGPADNITRAVTINTSIAEVWRWLVQIGCGRGGMYSYDWLENLGGLGIHSTNEIHDGWQRLATGDRIVLVPAGWMGMKEGYSVPVARVDRDRALVLRQSPPEHQWNAVWSFVIVPNGPKSCRLLSRSRTERRPGIRGLLMRLATEAMDPATMVMTRKMLLGVKQRAESRR